MALSSCLTGRSPEPTLGYTRNAGQRGRNSVDLRRERLSLESVSAVYRTSVSGGYSDPPKKHCNKLRMQHV